MHLPQIDGSASLGMTTLSTDEMRSGAATLIEVAEGLARQRVQADIVGESQNAVATLDAATDAVAGAAILAALGQVLDQVATATSASLVNLGEVVEKFADDFDARDAHTAQSLSRGATPSLETLPHLAHGTPSALR